MNTPVTSVKISQTSAPIAFASADAVRSEAPRPIVVISLSVLTPWNPAITQTLPSPSDRRTRSPLTSMIFALR